MTLRRKHGHLRFQDSSLKRRERSCRRWQLKVCCWINEESCPLDMHQVTLQPPSKPNTPPEVIYNNLLYRLALLSRKPIARQVGRVTRRGCGGA